MVMSPKKFKIEIFLRLFEGAGLFTATEALGSIRNEIARKNIAEQAAALDGNSPALRSRQ